MPVRARPLLLGLVLLAGCTGKPPPPAMVSLTVSVVGAGEVSSAPPGIEACRDECSADFEGGTRVTLIAAPAAGHELKGWSVEACGAALTCEVVLAEAQTVTVAFAAIPPAPTTYALTVTVAGEGKVSSTPPGIDACTESCSADFAQDIAVTLTATPASGYELQSWSVGACGQALTCALRLNHDQTVSATFAPTSNPNFSLSVTLGGDGDGRVVSEDGKISCPGDCVGEYAPGAEVALSAETLAEDAVFDGWGGACSGTEACTLTMTTNEALSASFTDTNNEAPTISGLADVQVAQNTSGPLALELPFTVSDPDDPAEDLALTAGSSAPALTGVPSAACDEAGHCTLTLQVRRDTKASGVVTVTARDSGGQEATASFTLTVAPLRVTTPDDSGAGSLRQAVQDALSGDVVVFDETLFAAAQTITLGTQLSFDKGLSVQGPGRDLLTLKGGGSQRLLYVAPGATVSLLGMTIRDGVGHDNAGSRLDGPIGGAVLNRGTLALKDVRLTNNRAMLGGAIYNVAGASLTLEDSIVAENRAERSGGAIFNDSQSAAGGILSTRLTIKNSQLSSNSAANYGGMLYNYESGTVVVLEGVAIEGNSSQSSSGIANGFLVCASGESSCVSHAGRLTIRDSSFVGNRSVPVTVPDANGALSNFGALAVYNTRFEANEGPAGAAIYIQYKSSAVLDNVQVLNNRAKDSPVTVDGQSRTIPGNGAGVNNEGALTIRGGSSIESNQADNSGGGIFNNGYVGTITMAAGNSVTLNVANADGDGSGTGGGIYNYGRSRAIANVAAGAVSGNIPNDIVDDSGSKLQFTPLQRDGKAPRL